MAVEALLSVNNIEVVYNKTVQVLRGLSLKVDKGAVVALLGSNGAGKSTTLKNISICSILGRKGHHRRDPVQGASCINGAASAGAERSLPRHAEGRRIFEDLTVRKISRLRPMR